MIKLIVKLMGTDPMSHKEICLSLHESDINVDDWSETDQHGWDYLLVSINKALDEAANYEGRSGLEALKPLHATLSVAVSADEHDFRPAFSFDIETIKRLSAAGVSFDYIPYAQR